MSKSTWIWYPGDFEIWLRTKVETRRQERGMFYPPIWNLYSHYHSIQFRKIVELDEPEMIRISAEGTFNVELDGRYITNSFELLTIPEGKHEILVNIVNESCIPSIYVEGNTINSDNSWKASNHDKRWVKVGLWNLNDPMQGPSEFRLATQEIYPVKVYRNGASLFAEFEKQTIGYIKLHEVTGQGKINLYYGESIEEAQSTDSCETLDSVEKSGSETETIELPVSRALRYIQILHSKDLQIGNISLMYEYLPLEYRGNFNCSNEKLNKIWETAIYTLHLNTREFFLDGIKRDRWVWSGDAYQSFLMNYYSFFDEAVNRRTLIALRGKDPVIMHLNTILDYSFYWFLSLYDYYQYTGDLNFIRENYDKLLSLIDFCLSRRNQNEMVEGLPGDWIFIDWADMDKDGELCAEQILLSRSLEIMQLFSGLLEDEKNSDKFKHLAKALKKKITEVFWDEEKGGLVNNRVKGKLNRMITKHPNIFALKFGLLTQERIEAVKSKVLLNENIPKIKTPYFRFYELDALCEIGEQEYVLKEILDYWGGMLDLGATTFWEEYDPTLNGAEHYAMYGRPFGKSLCHAWGASPIYLLGKYFLGVKPLSPGFETYSIEPYLGGLSFIEGTVPMPKGEVKIYMDKSEIRVIGTSGTGYLHFNSSIAPELNRGEIRALSNSHYEIEIKSGLQYKITYHSMK